MAPELEVLKIQAECMCVESPTADIPVNDNPLDDLNEEGLERAIKGQGFFDADLSVLNF